MLNKSIFFSKVPKYLYHKDKTPYFTNPKEMTLLQSQYELFSYGVLIGSIFSFIGLAAFLNYKTSSDFVYLIWMIFSLFVLASIHFTIKKSVMVCCVLISIAPSILVSHLIYDQFMGDKNFVKIILLSTLLMILMKYGLRLIKIVYYQNNKINLVKGQ
tara:strand:+ start:255 stop:728 length:474 start_codon:yes stop_codon:yes gene_type:complete